MSSKKDLNPANSNVAGTETDESELIALLSSLSEEEQLKVLDYILELKAAYDEQ